jgi:uncharacterized protein (DUF2141 family)
MIARPLALVMLLLVAACAPRTARPPVAGTPDETGTALLTVRLVGMQEDGAEVAVALYDSADSFADRSGALAKGWIRPREGAATWTVGALRPGEYAVAAYHDLNGNRRLDRSALGAPSEPYGFSNNARATFGPPKFAKASFRIDTDALTIEITLR